MYKNISITLPLNDTLKCTCILCYAAKLSTYISPHSLIIVWTFIIPFLGWRVLICSTTICTKALCIFDFFFPLLIISLWLYCLLVGLHGLDPISRWRWEQILDFLQSLDSFSCFIFLSYLPFFCVFFYYYSTLSWDFHILHILVTKVSLLSVVSQLRLSSYLQTWDPPLPHVCIEIE